MRVVSATASVCVLVVLLGCGAAGKKVGEVVGPSPSREGETWTINELVAHLKGKGLKVVVVQSGGGAGGPIPPFADLRVNEDWGDVVEIRHMSSAKDARESAGARGARGHAWGRFRITGSAERVADVRKALE